jgi:hypothetical protein
MPQLMIPLINEVFHTDYGEDEEITPLHNEHQTKSGEIITDSCLLIRNRMYHFECQSRPDATMAIRMIEYDFAIALEHTVQKDGVYEMEFPKSCTLYLRHTNNTPDELKVRSEILRETREEGRELGREEALQKTLQAILLYKKGESVETIVEQIGLSKEFVTRLVDK